MSYKENIYEQAKQFGYLSDNTLLCGFCFLKEQTHF